MFNVLHISWGTTISFLPFSEISNQKPAYGEYREKGGDGRRERESERETLYMHFPYILNITLYNIKLYCKYSNI